MRAWRPPKTATPRSASATRSSGCSKARPQHAGGLAGVVCQAGRSVGDLAGGRGGRQLPLRIRRDVSRAHVSSRPAAVGHHGAGRRSIRAVLLGGHELRVLRRLLDRLHDRARRRRRPGDESRRSRSVPASRFRSRSTTATRSSRCGFRPASSCRSPRAERPRPRAAATARATPPVATAPRRARRRTRDRAAAARHVAKLGLIAPSAAATLAHPMHAIAPEQRQRVVPQLPLRHRRVGFEAVFPPPEQLEPRAIPHDGIEGRQQTDHVIGLRPPRAARPPASTSPRPRRARAPGDASRAARRGSARVAHCGAA